jgi:hypothetical protein
VASAGSTASAGSGAFAASSVLAGAAGGGLPVEDVPAQAPRNSPTRTSHIPRMNIFFCDIVILLDLAIIYLKITFTCLAYG